MFLHSTISQKLMAKVFVWVVWHECALVNTHLFNFRSSLIVTVKRKGCTYQYFESSRECFLVKFFIQYNYYMKRGYFWLPSIINYSYFRVRNAKKWILWPVKKVNIFSFQSFRYHFFFVEVSIAFMKNWKLRLCCADFWIVYYEAYLNYFSLPRCFSRKK